jgi:sigma-B regulation protein RsbU (phosphoserine phosphatase)
MRDSLDLAREVQQNLLPAKVPEVKGLDIAGKSIYCDRTGGDYFDFITSPAHGDEPGDEPIGVVVGDVSGHGVSSALLMASVRGFMRQRASLPGGIDTIITDVNHELSKDVVESGRFMTLFYLLIGGDKRSVKWVRAGHDPAMIYDPGADSFEPLMGRGVALGLDEGYRYEAFEKSGLKPGQIIFLCTDGIFEARNRRGEMLGKKKIFDILRINHRAPAEEIIAAMLGEFHKHRDGVPQEDDVTLIVIKFG